MSNQKIKSPSLCGGQVSSLVSKLDLGADAVFLGAQVGACETSGVAFGEDDDREDDHCDRGRDTQTPPNVSGALCEHRINVVLMHAGTDEPVDECGDDQVDRVDRVTEERERAVTAIRHANLVITRHEHEWQHGYQNHTRILLIVARPPVCKERFFDVIRSFTVREGDDNLDQRLRYK